MLLFLLMIAVSLLMTRALSFQMTLVCDCKTKNEELEVLYQNRQICKQKKKNRIKICALAINLFMIFMFRLNIFPILFQYLVDVGKKWKTLKLSKYKLLIISRLFYRLYLYKNHNINLVFISYF